MGSIPSTTLQQCGPRDVRECAPVGKSDAHPSSLPPHTGVPTIAGAGHVVAVSHEGDAPGPGGASSSSPATASRAPTAADISSLLKQYGFTKGIETMSLDYLPDGEYRKFQRERVVPKRETGMVILSKNTVTERVERREYISPTAHQPGFQMPSNRRTFSFLTPDTTVPAILRLLSPSVSWNITILRVFLELETITEDIEDLVDMLPEITTALEHMKYLVLEIDRLQYVFNMGNHDGKPSLSEISVKNVARILHILTIFSQCPIGSKLDRCLYILASFPVHELLANVLHSIILTLDTEKDGRLVSHQKLAVDPKKPLDNRLKLSLVVNYNSAVFDPEIMELLPYISYFELYMDVVIEGSIPLDFSNFDQAVTLTVNCYSCTRFGPITLPLNKGNLEKLALNFSKCKGALTFPDSEPYSRLREIVLGCLPDGRSITPLYSKVFPALKRISCSSDSPVVATLDLSGIKNPGVDIDLQKYKGEVVLPSVGLGRLLVNYYSLRLAAIRAVIPRASDLEYSGRSWADVKWLFEMLRGTVSTEGAGAAVGAGAGSSAVLDAWNYTAIVGAGAGPYLASAVLERLRLEVECNITIRMGIFLHLQSLELVGISTTLDGSNFLMLGSLMLYRCRDVQLAGSFPSLSSLKLIDTSASMCVECTAPMLSELECVGMYGATNITIDPTVFPALQSLFISTEDTLPTFTPGIRRSWSEKITVRLDLRRIRIDVPPSRIPVNQITLGLPGCLLIQE